MGKSKMSKTVTEQERKQNAEELVFKLPAIQEMGEFAPIVFPNICPERDLNAYISSKIHTSDEHTEPNPDCVPGPGVELFNSRAMLNVAEERLSKIRLISKGRKAVLHKEWQLVIKLQLLLRDSVITFETFIKENMEKRERAHKKIHEELVLQDGRRENIDMLIYQMRRLYEVKKIFESNIRAFKMYEAYLQKVAGIYEYKDVTKIMQRFSALQEAKEISFERGQTIMRLIEQNTLALKHNAEENGFIIIGMKNKLCDLHMRYGKAEEKALLWETTVTAVRDQCLQRYEDRNILKHVCRNLYELMCRRKGKSAPSKLLGDNEHEGQLIVISKTLLLMEKIFKMINEAPSQDHKRSTSALSHKSNPIANH